MAYIFWSLSLFSLILATGKLPPSLTITKRMTDTNSFSAIHHPHPLATTSARHGIAAPTTASADLQLLPVRAGADVVPGRRGGGAAQRELRRDGQHHGRRRARRPGRRRQEGGAARHEEAQRRLRRGPPHRHGGPLSQGGHCRRWPPARPQVR